MKHKLNNLWNTVALVGALSGLGIASVPAAWAGNSGNAQVLPPHAHAFGKSYGEWSKEWWKWHFRLPATNHPAFSVDGANCGAGQSGKVWFLAGAFTNEFPQNEFNTVIRENCTVPTGKAIFFPIINVECSTIDTDPAFQRDDPKKLRTCAKEFVEGPNAIVKDLFVSVDGKPLRSLKNYRAQSPVFRFSFAKPDDNILGVDCKKVDCSKPLAASDGYWIMLPPLSSGKHTIRFAGSFRDPNSNALFFGLDVTYKLKVAGGGK